MQGIENIEQVPPPAPIAVELEAEEGKKAAELLDEKKEELERAFGENKIQDPDAPEPAVKEPTEEELKAKSEQARRDAEAFNEKKVEAHLLLDALQKQNPVEPEIQIDTEETAGNA
jgi:hypothetical protein